MKHIDYNKNSDFILKRIETDVSLYKSALDLWEGYRYDYADLLMEIFLRRGRSQEGLAVLKHVEPGNATDHIIALRDTLSEADEKLRSSVITTKQFKTSLKSATEQLHDLDALLDNARNAYEERIIFENDDLADMLNEYCSSFLEIFLRNKYMDDQWGHIPLLSRTAFEKYHIALSHLDQKFRKIFYIFTHSEYIIRRYREDAYVPEKYWWLSEAIPQEAPNESMLPRIIKEETARFLKQGSQDCPSVELIAAHAFNELWGKKYDAAETHIAQCPHCLKEVISLRHLNSITHIPGYTELKTATTPIPERISSLIETLLTGKEENLFDFVKDLAKKLKGVRKDIAAEIGDWIRGAIDGLCPGEIELVFADGMRGESKTVELRKKVIFTSRKRGERITLIDQSDRELGDMALLARGLCLMSFHYGLFGMGMDNRFKPLIQEAISVKTRGLPLIVDVHDIQDADIVWLVLYLDMENMPALHAVLQNCLEKRELNFSSIEPKLLENSVWLVLYISGKGNPD